MPREGSPTQTSNVEILCSPKDVVVVLFRKYSKLFAFYSPSFKSRNVQVLRFVARSNMRLWPMDKCRTSGDCDRSLSVTRQDCGYLRRVMMKSLWTSNQPTEKSSPVIEVSLRGRGMPQHWPRSEPKREKTRQAPESGGIWIIERTRRWRPRDPSLDLRKRRKNSPNNAWPQLMAGQGTYFPSTLALR